MYFHKLLFSRQHHRDFNDPACVMSLLHSVTPDRLDEMKALVLANHKSWNISEAMVKRVILFYKKHLVDHYGPRVEDVIMLFYNFSGHVCDKVLNKINHEGIVIL